ncbi:hypothetical protein ACSBR2_020737 [Camellia fascicularis]
MSKDHVLLHQSLPQEIRQEDCEEQNQLANDYEECRTPTSQDHKIPAIQTCPPAPRKQGHVFSRKRKFPESQFFEATCREEIDSFFRSSFELSGVPKKRHFNDQ